MNLSKTTAAEPYTIVDLLKLDATEFENLDSRVTSMDGKPNKGDRVVVINRITGEDVSVSLNDFEVDALLARINSMFRRDQCRLHGRSTRWFELNPTCTCAAVFSSRLLAHRATALANAVYGLSQEAINLAGEVRQALQEERSAWGWTAEQLAELDRKDQERARWVQAELKRLKA